MSKQFPALVTPKQGVGASQRMVSLPDCHVSVVKNWPMNHSLIPD